MLWLAVTTLLHSNEQNIMRWISSFPHLALPLVLACTPALAQSNTSGPLLLEKVDRFAAAKPKLQADLRVNVNMALVPVTVMDSMGRSVTGLTPQNFRLFDNSHQVAIASFARQDQPVALGLVFDCSRSMANKFRDEREAPRELFRQLGPRDESFLITVSNTAELRYPLTSNMEDIVNSLMFTHPNGATALLDGVRMALAELRKSKLPRKALIVVSDGGDNNSRFTVSEINSLAAESDAQIFTILFYKDPQAPEEVSGPGLLEKLATQSGGVSFGIGNIHEIHDVMAKIGINLHNQYVLGYYPPDDSSSGQYRKIAVQLLVPQGTPPLHLRAKRGYYLP
jgi:Ca-activated chloride channel family protein